MALTSAFKIHAYSVVKNEADILAYTLSAALEWCDYLYIIDNGSTDESWDIIQDIAAREKRIVPHAQKHAPFRDIYRAELFNAYRINASPNDWWVQLDGDEIYIDDPRKFLASIGKNEHVIWTIHYQYYLTEQDLCHHSQNPTESPPKISHSCRPLHYIPNSSEIRMYRHRQNLQWSSGYYPIHLGIPASKRIRVKHYQYRSPQQIQLRLKTRQTAFNQYPQWEYANWRETLVAADHCFDESRDGLDIDIDLTRLPAHLDSPIRKMGKKILLALGLY